MPTPRLHAQLFGYALAASTALFSWVPTGAAHAADEFPYLAYVVEPEAFARSGPGREHYATAELPIGFAVEVYRHDGAGWCAIRPPEGSFSLAPLQQVQLVDQRTARVMDDGIPARVGSALLDRHDAVQVMLQRGELLAIVEPPSPTNPWVRVAPPAGEFRWVAARRLSRTPPTEPTPPSAGSKWEKANSNSVSDRELAENAPMVAPPEPSSDDIPLSGANPFAHLREPARTTPPVAAAIAASGAGAPWAPQVATGPAANAVVAAGATSDIQVIAGSPAAAWQAQYQETLPTTPAAGFAPPPFAATGAPAPTDSTPLLATASSGPPRVRFEGLTANGPLDPRVAEMQLRLSQIVIGAPAMWQFGALRDEAASLLAQDDSPERREQLRDLLDRIAVFESVQARYRNLPPGAQVLAVTTTGGAAAAATDPTSAGVPATDPTAAANGELLARVQADLGRADAVTPTPGGPAPPPTEALYDAVGTLKPVVSKRPSAPQYALIDDHGDVVTFVTATPDINLQPYVGQRIGVRGARGFMPEYRRAHVTASRITTLEERLIK